MDRHAGLGLLSLSERHQLEALLMKVPDIDDPKTRRALVADQVPSIRGALHLNSGLFNDISEIVTQVDRSGALLKDGTWPIIWVIESAIRRSQETEVGQQLLGLLYTAQARTTVEAAIKPEARINQASVFADIAEWPARIDAAIRAVCLIETGEKTGTGFLVGPNLVMTNYHVIDTLLDDPGKRADVRLRFDYLYDSRDQALFQRQTYELDTDRPIIASPMDQLDCALLPVQGQPGEKPAAGSPPGARRGWLRLRERACSVDQPLFIVQHPDGQPLKVDVDLVLDVLKTRIRYRTSTLDSSSGAPCFNMRWEPVAIHQGTEDRDAPRFNQGVPFGEILKHPDFRAALPA